MFRLAGGRGAVIDVGGPIPCPGCSGSLLSSFSRHVRRAVIASVCLPVENGVTRYTRCPANRSDSPATLLIETSRSAVHIWPMYASCRPALPCRLGAVSFSANIRCRAARPYRAQTLLTASRAVACIQCFLKSNQHGARVQPRDKTRRIPCPAASHSCAPTLNCRRVL